MGRSWYGFDPGATPAELWENNRGDWRLLAERISAERWVALNYQLEDPAYEILPGTTPPKKALFGRILPEGHPVREALAGTQVLYSGRNAIQYDSAHRS